MNKIYNLDFNEFETRNQHDNYVVALKQYMLPLKFAYIGRAAHAHDKLVRSQEYGLADTEAELLKVVIASSILTKLTGSGQNVIDVGSGNGMKAVVVLEILRQKFSRLRYIGLDYSEELLRIALSNISVRLAGLSTVTYQIDFESSCFREIVERAHVETGYSSLLLFLGNTLGNPVNRRLTLSNIRASMGQKDTLLVGVELYRPDKVSTVLEHYRNEVFYRAVFDPLSFAGFQREDGILEVLFNELTKNVEVYFQFRGDITVRINASEIIQFKKGEKLLIFLSHKFDISELQEMSLSVGLRILEILLNEDHTYALVFANVS